MKILTVAVLSAGLAFPAVVENGSHSPRLRVVQQSKTMKRGAKKPLKKVKRGLLSVVLFLAEPEK